MKIKKNQQESVSLFGKFIEQLAKVLPTKTKPFFIVSTMGLKPSPSGETFRFYTRHASYVKKFV